jgi:hypothetical protein
MKPSHSIQQLIRLSLAVGLLAAFLAPGSAHAQEPAGSQGLWQTFTTANSGLGSNWVNTLLEDRAGAMRVLDRFLKLRHKEQTG